MASFSKLFSGAAVTLYLSLFAALASASPIGQVRADFESILAEKKDLIKRQGSFRAITGAQDGRTCPRISLRAMQNNPDQWALYLMATDTFKNMDQNAVFSYFDVAKVHGVPAEPWDGVQGNWNGNTAPGYCTHSNPVFPAWHRVYVALYEQAFLAAVQATINQFQGADRQRWQNAANCMRVPYWDWAQGPGKAATVVPDSLTAKYVNLPSPSGGSRTIINPIFRYDMHPLDPAGMAQNPWAMWPTTLRYPTRSDTVNTYSQNNVMVSSIQGLAQSLKDQVYNIFTQCGDYMQMANDAAPLSNGCSISLESVHNTMHNNIGGTNMGHMTYLWWAAFDPVFWIHHANVDRIFAMWQVIYPNNYITGGQSSTGTYSQPAGTYYDGNTPLDPFHRTDGSSWTTNQARDVGTFHYTYPELQQANGNPQAMINIVNQLYGNGGARASKRDLVGGLMDAATDLVSGASDMVQGAVGGVTEAVDNTVNTMTGADLDLHNMTTSLVGGTLNFVQAALPNLRADLANLLTPTGRQHDYTANVAADRFGLDGSFNIYIFIGEPDGEPADFPTSKNLVGSQGVFSNPGMKMDNLIVTGAVPLTTALVAQINAGALESLDEEHVGPFLRQNLKWRVVKAEGTEVPVDQVPGFKVGIVRSNVTPAEHDSAFPTWHGFETVSAITDGMLGGLNLHQEWHSWDKDDQC